MFILAVVLLSCGISQVVSIECYTGLGILKGSSVGSTTIRCDNSAAYCYNMTASTASIIEVTKAGCSMWRCMLAQNKCISTVFQNIPISLCCCNTPLCNIADNNQNGGAIQSQKSGGWNAEPEQRRTDLTHEEVANRFSSAELDEDHSHQHPSSRAERSSTLKSDNVPEPTAEAAHQQNSTRNLTETSENVSSHLGDEIELLL